MSDIGVVRINKLWAWLQRQEGIPREIPMTDEPQNRTITFPDYSGEAVPYSVLARLEAKLDWIAAALQQVRDVRWAMIVNDPRTLPPYPEKP